MKKYSQEMIEFLKEYYPKFSIKELTILFNERFNLDLTEIKLKSILSRYKIHSGRTAYFEKGHQPFNKGKKQTDYISKEGIERSKKTRFAKGQNINKQNHNHLPIGAETVGKDGYLLVKVSKPIGNKSHLFLVYKHRLIYEQAHGPIPKGYNVIFADGNNRNFDIDNLILVSNNELLKMNQYNLYYKGCSEATKCGVLIAKIKIKQSEVKKNGN